MLTVKNFPWVSLTLLLVTYTILGWQLYAFKGPVFLWIVVVVADLLLAVALSTSGSHKTDGFTLLFKSDSRAFFVAVTFAFFSVAIITWLHVFVHILVVIAAGTLVRLDAQTARLSSRQSFWFMAIFSLAGLGLGALAQKMMSGEV
jgi:hypothetical protein